MGGEAPHLKEGAGGRVPKKSLLVRYRTTEVNERTFILPICGFHTMSLWAITKLNFHV